MRTTVPAAAMALLCLLAVVPATGIATQPPAANDGFGTDSTAGGAGGVAGGGLGVAGFAAGAPTAPSTATNSTTPPDPESDRLGWENGRWHNESIAVDAADGLNESESARLLNRTMARVEFVRQVEFERPVDLNFRTRSEYAAFTSSHVAAINATAANVQYEALGFVGERTDAMDVLREASAGFATAFVVTRDRPGLGLQQGDVTIITENGSATYQEWILAHELVHTLQVQELDADFGRGASNADELSAVRSVVEGDANYVTHRYRQRCGAAWSCVTPSQSRPPRSFGPAFAVNALKMVWYGNGPQLVADRYRAGGWSAVTDALHSPPPSTEQVIHPDKYRTDAPQSVTVADRSGEAWQPLTVGGERAGYTAGEAGLFTMLWYPSVRARAEVVLPLRARLNRSQPSPHPFDYDHELSAGWDGDRLVPYVSDSAGANETGFVWRIEWDSPADAAEFADAYEQLLAHRGATAVAGRAGTFRVPDGEQFGDAFYVEQNGSTVLIVNAPTVAALQEVRAGAAPEVTPTPTPTPTPTTTPTPTPSPTPSATPTATPTPSPTAGTPTATTTTTGGTGPGFGGLVAVLAVGLGLLAGRRRL